MGIPCDTSLEIWESKTTLGREHNDDVMEERNHEGDERKEGGKLLGSRTPVDDKKDVAVMCGKRREGTERKMRREAGEPASRRKGADISVICGREAREASGRPGQGCSNKYQTTWRGEKK